MFWKIGIFEDWKLLNNAFLKVALNFPISFIEEIILLLLLLFYYYLKLSKILYRAYKNKFYISVPYSEVRKGDFEIEKILFFSRNFYNKVIFWNLAVLNPRYLFFILLNINIYSRTLFYKHDEKIFELHHETIICISYNISIFSFILNV